MSTMDRTWDDVLDEVDAGLGRAELLVRAGTLDDLVDVLGTRPAVSAAFPARLASRAAAALERTRALEAVVAAHLEDAALALGADHHRTRTAPSSRLAPAYVDARA